MFARNAVFLLLVIITPQISSGIEFQFDYSYDAQGFFDVPERREALEMAGRLLNRYVDDLAAVEPDENNTWQTFIVDPAGNHGLQLIGDFAVPKDTIIVYVAGNNLSPERLAQTIDGPGVGTGTPEFEDAVHFRSQPGAADSPATDHGALTGSIGFNDDLDEVPWYFGLSENGMANNEFDFITVAVHELTHFLGFGTAKSFRDHIGTKFIPADGDDPSRVARIFEGPESVAVGSPNNRILEMEPDPFAPDHHFAQFTKSRYRGRLSDSLMAPGIFVGERQYLTDLDRAALRDIGWEEATAGDANLDRVFNSADLVVMFQAAKYETGEVAAWSEGDFNDNARFTSADLTVAFAEAWYVNAATSADAVEQLADSQIVVGYDPNTGELHVESGQPLATLEIESVNGVFQPAETIKFDGVFDVSRTDKLFILDADGIDTSLTLGAVLPANLGFDQIHSELSFDGALLGGGRLSAVRLEMVPEPAQLVPALIAVSLLSIFLRKPWRRSV